MARATWTTAEAVTSSLVNQRHLDILSKFSMLGSLYETLTFDSAITEETDDPHARVIIPIIKSRYLVFFFETSQVVNGGTPATAFISARLNVWGTSVQLWQHTIATTGELIFRTQTMEGVTTLGDVTGLRGELTFHVWRTAGTYLPQIDGLVVVEAEDRDEEDFFILNDPTGLTT